MNASFSFRFSDAENRKLGMLIVGLVVAAFALTMVQDLFLSMRNNYRYFWTESLLFNTFWFWFIPATIGLKRLIKYKTGQAQRKGILIAVLIIIAIILLHALLYAATVTLISSLFFGHRYGMIKVLTYTTANDLDKYLLIYGGLAFLFYRQQLVRSKSPVLTPEIPPKAITELVIEQGKDRVLVPANEIVMICSASPYIAIHTATKKYLYTATLRAIAEQLDGNLFVRVHKSTIINTQFVASYRSRLNGDYDILLHNQQEVRLSRNYVQVFKQILADKSSS